MGMLKRNAKKLLEKIVLDYNKMAFVSGPRQSGKTTLAKACSAVIFLFLFSL
jgi:predicted AAA+ superfamily ATPase